jgi:hypothetical protein
MTPLRLVLLLAVPALLAACDNPPPPPQPPAPTPVAPTAEAQPAPSAPLPTAPVAQPETEVAVLAPTPAPSSSRPLTDSQRAALEPLFGTWATDLKNCDRGAITISASRFEGAENGCDITSLVDSGNWNFVASLSCTSQGQTAQERIAMVPLFAPTGEGIGLTYLDRDNQQVTVLRCD